MIADLIVTKDAATSLIAAFTSLTFQILAVPLSTATINIKKFLHGTRFVLSVLYVSQNRQRFLLYTSLTDCFL